MPELFELAEVETAINAELLRDLPESTNCAVMVVLKEPLPETGFHDAFRAVLELVLGPDATIDFFNALESSPGVADLLWELWLTFLTLALL